MITQENLNQYSQEYIKELTTEFPRVYPNISEQHDQENREEDAFHAGFLKAVELLTSFHKDNEGASPFYSGNSATILVTHFSKLVE